MSLISSEKWNWKALQNRVEETGKLGELKALRELISLEDARFLFTQITRLDEPEKIGKLADYHQRFSSVPILPIGWGGHRRASRPSRNRGANGGVNEAVILER